jgi:hypothetical protein
MKVPSLSRECEIYPSQTKILEGGTKDECWLFEALFKVVSTLFGLLTIEKSVEKPDFIICSSFQNLRLGSIKLRNFLFAIPCLNHCLTLSRRATCNYEMCNFALYHNVNTQATFKSSSHIPLLLISVVASS